MGHATLDRHGSDDILLVAAGLMRALHTDDAAEQLRRLYGSQRVVTALSPLARPRPAPHQQVRNRYLTADGPARPQLVAAV